MRASFGKHLDGSLKQILAKMASERLFPDANGRSPSSGLSRWASGRAERAGLCAAAWALMVEPPRGVELWRSDGARVAVFDSLIMKKDRPSWSTSRRRETPGTDARQGLLRPAVRRPEAGRKDTVDTVTSA